MSDERVRAWVALAGNAGNAGSALSHLLDVNIRDFIKGARHNRRLFAKSETFELSDAQR